MRDAKKGTKKDPLLLSPLLKKKGSRDIPYPVEEKKGEEGIPAGHLWRPAWIKKGIVY